MNELLTANELAAKLRVTADTIRRWCRDDRIPAYRASGRPILFDLGAVLNALSTRTGDDNDKDGRGGNARGPP